jgi:hypothetical protein
MNADVDPDVTVEIRVRDAEVAQLFRHRISGVIRDQQKRAPGFQALLADRRRILRAQKLM